MELRTNREQPSADADGRGWTMAHENAAKLRRDQMQKEFCD